MTHLTAASKHAGGVAAMVREAKAAMITKVYASMINNIWITSQGSFLAKAAQKDKLGGRPGACMVIVSESPRVVSGVLVVRASAGMK